MILLISGVFPPEPVVSASLAYDLAVELSKITEVKVITPKPSRPFGFIFKNEIEKGRKFEHIILESFISPKSRLFGRMFESYSFGKNVVDYLKNNRADLKCVYLNTWPLLAQYLIVKELRKISVPIILHVQDIYPESLLDKLPLFKSFFIKLLLPIDKYVQSNSAKVIVISPKMKSYLIKSRRLKEDNVRIVYNWQNENRFISYTNSKKSEQKNSNFTFMFLGNLNKTASIDFIISAYKKSSLENSRLIIAGDGSEKDKLISSAGNSQNINIEFWDAPMKKVPEIQNMADVLILNLKKGASLYALPSKLAAYMFSAKPIIACVDEESDTAFSVTKADCGWIVPSEETESLATTLKTAISIPKNKLQNLGINGFDYAMENFSKKKNLKKLIDIIREGANIQF